MQQNRNRPNRQETLQSVLERSSCIVSQQSNSKSDLHLQGLSTGWRDDVNMQNGGDSAVLGLAVSVASS